MISDTHRLVTYNTKECNNCTNAHVCSQRIYFDAVHITHKITLCSEYSPLEKWEPKNDSNND